MEGDIIEYEHTFDLKANREGIFFCREIIKVDFSEKKAIMYNTEKGNNIFALM